MYVLLIEDDEIDQMAFKREMATLGYRFVITSTLKAALELVSKDVFDLIITDYKLPDGTAIDLLKAQLTTPVIITTGTGREEIAVEALKLGAADYLVKDLNRAYLKLLPTVMIQTLKRKKSEDQKAMLVSAIKGIVEGILITDNDNIICFVNEAFCKLFGYKEEEIFNQHASLLSERLERQILSHTYLDLISTIFTYSRPNESDLTCIVSHSTVENEKKQKIATITTYKDITKHIEMEQALLTKAEELARTRAELEQLELFSFVSTHDLQEPLHKIITFGNLFMKEESVVLTPTAREYRDKIYAAAQELSQMISQLHDYSKILTEGVQFTPVNLNAVVHDVLSKLSPQIKETEAQIHVDPLPTILGDQRQLYKLFLNLLRNALLFRRKEVIPEIRILLNQTKTAIEISIQDNGIGIDESYLPQLFTPFKRLHTSTEFPGRGLGLAICKRVIQRHAGKIGVTSTLGKGTTFTLSFPANGKTS